MSGDAPHVRSFRVVLKRRLQWVPALGGALCVALGVAELLYAGSGTGTTVVGIVALLFGGVVLLDSLRPVVVASRESLRVRQLLRDQVLPWDRVERLVVRRTTLYSCLAVELTDGTTVDCRAAQASSKSKAGQAQLQAWVAELNRYREARRWDS
jgi:PH (Pleckstrin Homology) domain-containing protein